MNEVKSSNLGGLFSHVKKDILGPDEEPLLSWLNCAAAFKNRNWRVTEIFLNEAITGYYKQLFWFTEYPYQAFEILLETHRIFCTIHQISVTIW